MADDATKQAQAAAPAAYQPPPYVPGLDPARFVPHWEIQNMINTSIQHYDVTTAGPRFLRLEGCMTRVEKLLEQISGGMTVVKWAAGLLTIVGTGAGIVYSVGKITGHL